ncbi:MAG: ribonuclease HII [Prevotellaceae bacterium]|jgi:ribonuclease HII|nr:ribonuclease HII [Prevotellaceae bacterium]
MKKRQPKPRSAAFNADSLLFPQEPFNGLRLKYSSFQYECGCDEAGRGCLAGSVMAAAVVLPANFDCPLLNDSKQLSKEQREKLRPLIEEQAVAWAVASVDNAEIDRINILNASILAMHRAIEKLRIEPDFIIVDGNKFKPYKNIPYQTIVKGDSKFLSIAAASVLAKTHRDEYMRQLHQEHNEYDWSNNKAYATRKHREAIRRFGVTPYHRLSYDLLGTPNP